MNNRRKLVIALGAGALAAPFASFAQQQTKIWRVGFLSLRAVAISETDYYYGPFRQGMRELGYVEGKNLLIEWRSAEGSTERLQGLATELVNLKVDAIVAAGGSTHGPAKKATTTIPIVIVGAADPVGTGLVKSLARPGGNVTGVSNFNVELGPKLLEMLHSMVPKLSRVAVLISIDDTNTVVQSTLLKNVEAAARSTGTTILPFYARTPQEVENAFSQMARQKVGALIVTRHPYLNQQVRQIVELTAKNRLPAIAGLREYVEAGGLMSYGSSLNDQYHRAATYVDKILKGAKPSDLPVEQPTIFELFINGKTAKALGLKIPQSLLASADKVIE
jgi:putative ABC transport system substrate-binding protein